jgi:methyl-accepting chemotaxis protein/CHASE3 domain sensor protein
MEKIMSFWRNLKIGVRLGIGIGIILVMLAIVSAASYVGLHDGDANFGQYRALARQTAAAGVINSDLLTARLNVKEFLLKGSDQSVEAVDKAIAEMEHEVERSGSLFNDSAEERQEFESIAHSAKAYEEGFAKVVEFRKQRNGFVDQLNELGPKIEKNLSEVMQSAFTDGDATAAYHAGDALRTLLLARLYVNKFLVENEQEQVDRVHKEMTDFDHKEEVMLAEIQNPGRRQLLEEAIKMTKTYETAFEGASTAIFARNEIIANELNKIGPDMAATLDKLIVHNKEQQDELGPRASAEMEQSLDVALIVSGLALVLGLTIGFIVARGITKPIGAMTSAMGVLAGGDTSVEIPAAGQKDEIGSMASAVQVFKDNMIETERLHAEQAASKKRAEEERKKMMLDMAEKFESSVGGIVTTVTSAAEELQRTAQAMSATAEETSRQSNAVAAASEQMTQNVQTVASATEELSSSIREIGNQVTESTRIVGGAVTQAGETNAKVKALAEAAQKIGDVVTLINEIASQTNLLALNATIEAARAGDAGKGFAVVASEVKNLASQTAKATDEIAGQVKSIQESTDSSAQAIQGITETINRVSEISTAIASAVEEQGAATQEISRNVQQAATGTTEVSSNIAGVTQASQQTSSGATQVLASAAELAKNGAMLRTQVDEFLREIRAG